MANQLARTLRKRLTPQEVKLWTKLREMKASGFHFRRQAPIGSFIVDFVCFRMAIVVEVDGGQHSFAKGAKNDLRRDAILRSQGFRIMRFWNSDVDRNLEGVVDTIRTALKHPHPDRLLPVDPPHKGEG